MCNFLKLSLEVYIHLFFFLFLFFRFFNVVFQFVLMLFLLILLLLIAVISLSLLFFVYSSSFWIVASIIIIIMSRRLRGYPWPSLATSPYHSSPPAGLQGYIPCPHTAAVCRFVLVVPPLNIHVCWVLFLLLFSTHRVCLCHLFGVMPCAPSSIYLFSGPFAQVPLVSILKKNPEYCPNVTYWPLTEPSIRDAPV